MNSKINFVIRVEVSLRVDERYIESIFCADDLLRHVT